MFKKFIVALAALVAATAFAAVDANKGNQAELESVKGIGPAISTLIINERKKGDFKDWNDMVVRVKGIGDKSAAKLSEGGLTVNGAAYPGAPAKADAPVTAKVASAASRAASAAKGAAKTAASATVATAAKAASAVKAGASAVASDAKDDKDAFKENVKDAKAKRADKKAAKAAAAASAASAAKK
jgi:competence protein ComEA